MVELCVPLCHLPWGPSENDRAEAVKPRGQGCVTLTVEAGRHRQGHPGRAELGLLPLGGTHWAHGPCPQTAEGLRPQAPPQTV